MDGVIYTNFDLTRHIKNIFRSYLRILCVKTVSPYTGHLRNLYNR